MNDKETGDKIPAEDKTKIETEINAVKEALKGTDSEAIKAASEKLTQVFYEISSKLYQQNPNQGGSGFDPNGQAGGSQSAGGDNVYDADYKVVDDEDNK